MNALVPFHPLPPPPFAWTLPAALQLIRERRILNNLFQPRHGHRSHGPAWNQVAINLFATSGFNATADQCRSKWNSLKRGIIIIFFNIIIIKIFSLF